MNKPEFKSILNSLNDSELDSYLARRADQTPDAIAQDPHVRILRDQDAAVRTAEALRNELNFRGKHAADLFILAAIVADAGTHGAKTPKIFFSTNQKEFRPKTSPDAKVPEGFYEKHRLVWRSDFDLQTAVGSWKAKYP